MSEEARLRINREIEREQPPCFEIDKTVLKDVAQLLGLRWVPRIRREQLEVGLEGMFIGFYDERYSRAENAIRVSKGAPVDAANETIMHELVHARQWELAQRMSLTAEARRVDRELPYKDQWQEAEADALAPLLAARFKVAVPTRAQREREEQRIVNVVAAPAVPEPPRTINVIPLSPAEAQKQADEELIAAVRPAHRSVATPS